MPATDLTDGAARRGRPRTSMDDRFRSGRAFERIDALGGMFRLAGKVLASTVRAPREWVGEAVVEAGSACRSGFWPQVVSQLTYTIGFGILLVGLILKSIGLVDREPGVIAFAWSREVACWITGMVVAGVIGSAYTADLGSRKIREELDALDVLGVSQLRTLILPRVVAVTLATPVLTLFALFLVNVVNYILAPGALNITRTAFITNLNANLYPEDVFLSIGLKMAIIGFIIGIVSCYKGVSSKAGAEGVGRAVNETVVITFCAVWMFNGFFNLAYFALFPDISVFRG